MIIQICSQNGLANLATNLDYHSVGYRGHISCDIEKLEQFHFRLTGPNSLWILLSDFPSEFLLILSDRKFAV